MGRDAQYILSSREALLLSFENATNHRSLILGFERTSAIPFLADTNRYHLLLGKRSSQPEARCLETLLRAALKPSCLTIAVNVAP